jgi:hypothetical protein
MNGEKMETCSVAIGKMKEKCKLVLIRDASGGVVSLLFLFCVRRRPPSSFSIGLSLFLFLFLFSLLYLLILLLCSSLF